MNRPLRLVGFSVCGAAGATFVVACSALAPYPSPDPTGPYAAGYQASSAGGGTGGLPDSGFGEGGLGDGGFGEGGLPDSSVPPCTGCGFVASANWAQSIALDKNNVYWAEATSNLWNSGPIAAGAGTITGTARPGGGSTTVQASGLTGPFIVKQNGGWFVWSALQGYGAGMSSVQTLQVGSSSAPATPGMSLHNAHGVALDAVNAYWVVSDMSANFAVVESAPLGGGAVTTLGTTTSRVVPRGIAVNATDLYFAGDDFTPSGSSGVYQIPISSGAPVPIWTAASATPIDVALDGANVYWTDFGSGLGPDGSVYSMPLGGGSLSTIATGLNGPRVLALDSTNVYFNTSDGVYEAAKGGTTANQLVVMSNVLGVAADDNDSLVYFTTPTQILNVGK